MKVVLICVRKYTCHEYILWFEFLPVYLAFQVYKIQTACKSFSVVRSFLFYSPNLVWYCFLFGFSLVFLSVFHHRALLHIMYILVFLLNCLFQLVISLHPCVRTATQRHATVFQSLWPFGHSVLLPPRIRSASKLWAKSALNFSVHLRF